MFDGKEYLTVQEAQEYCSCSRSSLDKARAKGLLHAVKGGFKLRYRKAELQDWIAGKLKAQAQTTATDAPETESHPRHVPTQDGEQGEQQTEQDTTRGNPQGETKTDTPDTDTQERTGKETLHSTPIPSAPQGEKPHGGEPFATPAPAAIHAEDNPFINGERPWKPRGL